jgi:hypothetical protein
MPELATTLTVGAIVALAFTKFIEAGSSELAKKFTAESIEMIDKLLKMIWSHLKGKSSVEEIRTSIEKNNRVTPDQLNQIATYLHVAMDEDLQFANEVRLLAQEIEKGRISDQNNMIQHNYGQAKGWQTKVEGGTAYIGEIHIENKSD